MTTIACSRDAMACDSRVTFGNEFATVDDKVLRLGDELIGTAGDTDAIFKFLEWYRSRGAPPEIDGEKRWEVVVLNKRGIFVYINSFYSMHIKDRIYSAGSGGMAARAAMLCGKTPAQAVEVAIKCDNNSGGPVRSYSLADT